MQNLFNFGFRKLYLLNGGFQVSEEVGLFYVPHIHPNMFDCHDVVDQLLDQT